MQVKAEDVMRVANGCLLTDRLRLQRLDRCMSQEGRKKRHEQSDKGFNLGSLRTNGPETVRAVAGAEDMEIVAACVVWRRQELSEVVIGVQSDVMITSALLSRLWTSNLM